MGNNTHLKSQLCRFELGLNSYSKMVLEYILNSLVGDLHLPRSWRVALSVRMRESAEKPPYLKLWRIAMVIKEMCWRFHID